MKPARFVGRAKHELRTMNRAVQREVGFEIHQVQRGDNPSDFKPMPAVGPGTFEIRVRDEGRNTIRVFYVTKFEEAVYILHAFEKKTQTTPKHNLAIGKARYRLMQQERRKQYG